MNAGHLDAKLRREEVLVRGGPAPVRAKYTNGLFRIEDDTVVFSAEVEKFSEQTLRILEVLLLAKGEWVKFDDLGSEAWDDPPAAGAIRTAVGVARKKSKPYGLVVSHSYKSSYRVTVGAVPPPDIG